jgi:hypothetical protein
LAVFRTAFPVAMCVAPYARHKVKTRRGAGKSNCASGAFTICRAGGGCRAGRRFHSRATGRRTPGGASECAEWGPEKPGFERIGLNRCRRQPFGHMDPPFLRRGFGPLRLFRRHLGLALAIAACGSAGWTARRRWRAPRLGNASPVPEPPAVPVWPRPLRCAGWPRRHARGRWKARGGPWHRKPRKIRRRIRQSPRISVPPMQRWKTVELCAAGTTAAIAACRVG